MKLSEKAQASLNKVVEKFKSGDLSPIVETVKLQLDPDAPALNWSLSNRVLAFTQTGTLDCRGYRQWQSVNRYVKKGSAAAYILSPVTVKKENDNGEEARQCIGFKATPVFSVEDTDGEELPGTMPPPELPPLDGMAQTLGISVNYMPLVGAYGDCTPDGDKIRLATHDEAVFFHELAHAAHARLEKLKGGQHESQETVAELTACVLMEFYGLRDNTGNAWDYIARYADDPLTAITKALKTVEDVLGILLPC
jgi:hypothetical protein